MLIKLPEARQFVIILPENELKNLLSIHPLRLYQKPEVRQYMIKLPEARQFLIKLPEE